MDIKKELQDLCDRYKAEAEKILSKAKAEKKAWKPECEKSYWFINSWGRIDDFKWEEGDYCCEGNYSLGNCFPTKEAAEFAVEKLKVIAELKRFAEEHNEPMDWKNADTKKIFLFYNQINSFIGTDTRWAEKSGGTIYFSSPEIAKAAIEAIGEERLKKYYFEVEG